MLKTLREIIQPDTIEELDEQLDEIRQSIQHARDVLAASVDAPAVAEAESALDALCKTQLRLESKKDLARRRNAEAKTKEAADKKAMVDKASDAAIAALSAFAVEKIEPMILNMAVTLATFIEHRNKVLATAAAAKNVEALRRAQNSTNVLDYFIRKTMLPLTGARSSYDAAHGRTFSDFLREGK
jgi:hypothetical protein